MPKILSIRGNIMIAKFSGCLTDFDYVVGFDLAYHKSGIAIYDIKSKKILDTFKVNIVNGRETSIFDLYLTLGATLDNISTKYNGRILAIKEAMPVQCGKFTTVQTLQQLAKAHAALDICLYERPEEYFVYDETGIHSISVKSLFKKNKDDKPTKQDIQNELRKIYNLDGLEITDDISDAIAVIHTLIHKKWNADIKDEIKAVKRDIKGLKQEYTINNRKRYIDYLTDIMIKEEDENG